MPQKHGARDDDFSLSDWYKRDLFEVICANAQVARKSLWGQTSTHSEGLFRNVRFEAPFQYHTTDSIDGQHWVIQTTRFLKKCKK